LFYVIGFIVINGVQIIRKNIVGNFPPIFRKARQSGFGGLGVSALAFGSNPAEAVGFFRAKKILSAPSFGRVVKPWIPCR
jgi:hypothetical protein